jgi:hypothetical protein
VAVSPAARREQPRVLIPRAAAAILPASRTDRS